MQIANVNLVAEHANADHEQVKGSFTSYVLTLFSYLYEL